MDVGVGRGGGGIDKLRGGRSGEESTRRIDAPLLQECKFQLHHSIPKVRKPHIAWSQAAETRFEGLIAGQNFITPEK